MSTPENAATPWNHVVLGDGSRARLIPCGAWLIKRAADGHLSCNHSDSDECVVANHETHTLYRVEVECGYDACRVQRGEWNERLARIATFGNIAPCPIHSEAVNGN